MRGKRLDPGPRSDDSDTRVGGRRQRALGLVPAVHRTGSTGGRTKRSPGVCGVLAERPPTEAAAKLVRLHADGIYNRIAKLKQQFPAVKGGPLQQQGTFQTPSREGDRA